MATRSINVELSFASLPEGWQGTPQSFLAFMEENAVFSATGDFLIGQIGGARPVSDVGLYINGTSIEVWSGGSNGKYVPINTVPVGVIFDWPSQASAPPDNYLFCEGQLVKIDDYKDLYAAIGANYNLATGADPVDSFRIPDFRGRTAVGGSGTPGYQDPLNQRGALTVRSVSAPDQYFGNEWPTYNLTYPPNTSSPRYSATIMGAKTNKIGGVAYPFGISIANFNGIMPPCLAVRKIIRFR